MALTPVPIIDPGLGDAPDPADDEAVFEADAYDFTSRMPGFGSDIKAIGDATYLNAQWAETKAGEAATSASSAADSESAAALSETNAAQSASDAELIVVKFQGELASDPALNKTGSPLTTGDWYINTVSGLIRAYNGSAFVNSLNVTAGVTEINGLSGPVSSPTQAEAEAGTESAKPMSALRTAQAIAAQRAYASQAEAESGVENTKVLTSLRVKQAITANTTPAFSIGDVVYTARTLPSPTWLPCDGSIYLQSSYAELYALLGALANGVASSAGGVHTSTPSSGPWLQSAIGTTVVACAGGGNIDYSTDSGATWVSSGVSPLGSFPSLVAAGNKVFQWDSGTAGTQYRYTTNGTSWTTSNTLPTSQSWRDVSFGNSVYVATSGTTAAATSSDGITWTARTYPSGINYTRFLNGKFIGFASGATTTRYTSTDGVNWTANSGLLSISLSGSFVANSTLYVYDSANKWFKSSSDGLTFSDAIIPDHYFFGDTSFCYSNGRFYAAGFPANTQQPSSQATPIYSYNLVDWFPVSGAGTGATIYSNPVSNGSYVIYSATNTNTSTVRIQEFTYNKATQIVTPMVTKDSALKAYIKAK